MSAADLVSAVREQVEQLVENRGLPGLSVAVTSKDAPLATEVFGYADLANRTPMAPETLLEIGSIGKTFTAVVLLHLQEEGAVDLRDPVTRHLPWFEVPSADEPIELHHLLTHTAGIVMGPELSGDSRFDVWLLRNLHSGSAPGSAPGARYHYSNVGYRTLGYVVEAVTGRTYPEVAQSVILDRLGLEATEPAISSAMRSRLAVGYERVDDDRPHRRSDPLVPAPWLATGTGDGSLAASASDLAAFFRMLLNEGNDILSPESFALMLAESIDCGDGSSYGYGLRLLREEGRRLIGHGGSMPGYAATMHGDPEAGLGVVVLLNESDETDTTDEIAAFVLDAFRSGEVTRPFPDPLSVPGASAYEGRYSGGSRSFELGPAEDRLMLSTADARVALEPRGEDRFFVDHPDFALFLLSFRRDEGVAVEARHGADVFVREGHPPTGTATTPNPEWSAFTGHYRSYSPWLTNFRVLLRGNELVLALPWGPEDLLTPIGEDTFRVEDDEESPERLHFDAFVDGEPLRATLSGAEYYRVPSASL
jgi:D-alanyl-D-alanine carboxypeptidase